MINDEISDILFAFFNMSPFALFKALLYEQRGLLFTMFLCGPHHHFMKKKDKRL